MIIIGYNDRITKKAIQQQQKDPEALPREREENPYFVYLSTNSPSSSLLEALLDGVSLLKEFGDERSFSVPLFSLHIFLSLFNLEVMVD